MNIKQLKYWLEFLINCILYFIWMLWNHHFSNIFLNNFHQIRFSKRNKCYKIAFNGRIKKEKNLFKFNWLKATKQNKAKQKNWIESWFFWDLLWFELVFSFLHFASITQMSVMTVNMKVNCFIFILCDDDINILFTLRRMARIIYKMYNILQCNTLHWSCMKIGFKFWPLFLFVEKATPNIWIWFKDFI